VEQIGPEGPQGAWWLESAAEPRPGRLGKLQFTGPPDVGPVQIDGFEETKERFAPFVTLPLSHLRLAVGFVSELWS
jgi:hypothetical protein